MFLRILLINTLFFNSVILSSCFAKESTKPIPIKKLSNEEKKKQRALEKQKEQEAKEKQKLEKARMKKEKQDEEDKLLVVTPEDLAKFRRIVKKLTSELGRDPNDYRLTVQESAQFNASASLQKRLTVNSAAFHKLKTEAGLATVIAHEIGHIESKDVSKSLATGVASGAIIIAGGILTGSTDTARLLNGVTGTARKAHSRSQERAADLFAVHLMNKAYCKVPNKLEAYKIFIANDTNTGYFSQYNRTHPMSQDRYDYMAKSIRDAGCAL